MPFEETWNPLATTRLSPNIHLNTAFDIGYGPGNWNAVPVRVFLTPLDGIQATYETLALGFYVNIRRCFADQVGYPEAVPEFTTYVGSAAYGQHLVDFMNTTTAAKGYMDEATIRAIARDETRQEVARLVTALCNDDEELLAKWNALDVTGGLIGYVDRINAGVMYHEDHHPGPAGALVRGDTVKLS